MALAVVFIYLCTHVHVCAHIHATVIIKEKEALNLRGSGGMGGVGGRVYRRGWKEKRDVILL